MADRPAPSSSSNITVIIPEGAWTVQTYLEEFAEGCPEQYRPYGCFCCGADRKQHHHSHYFRTVYTPVGAYPITVYRFQCPVCKKTQGLLPSFTGSHEQVSWDVKEQVIRERSEGASLIGVAPIVSRQTPMLPGEMTRQMQEIASRSYTIPGSCKTSVSVRSLERYITGYRKDGWEGLKPRPKSKTGNRSIRPEALQQAIDLRRERPERSVEHLIYLLERSGAAKPGEIAASTLSRNLRQAGLSRQELLETHAEYRRLDVADVYSAPHCQDIFCEKIS